MMPLNPPAGGPAKPVDLAVRTNPGKSRESARRRALRTRKWIRHGFPKPRVRQSRATGTRSARLRPWTDRCDSLDSCQEGEPVNGLVVFEKRGSSFAMVKGARCKQRGCEGCDGARARAMVARLVPHLTRGAILITFTLMQGRYSTGVDSFEAWRGMWRAFTDSLFRAYPWLRKKAWVTVPEPHKSGRVHAHMVLGMRFFSIKILQEFWTAVGGGNVDVSGMKGKGEQAASEAAWYVAKYISKGCRWTIELQKHFRETGARLMLCSRTVSPVPPQMPEGWFAWFCPMKKLPALEARLGRLELELVAGSPWELEAWADP